MKRMFYSVILIMLAPDKKDVDSQSTGEYKHYQRKLSELAVKYNAIKDSQKTSVKQDENWVSWNKILSLQKTMMKQIIKLKPTITRVSSQLSKKGKKKLVTMGNEINRKQRTLIQNTLIVSLYTLIKPRRLDFADMKIISLKNYNNMNTGTDRESSNFLVIVGKNKKFFSFGRQAQKNQNTDRNGVRQKIYTLDVPPKLNKILNIYLLFHPELAFVDSFITRPFLYNTRGKAITGDGLSKAMIKIMKEAFNKNISPTMLRTIYLSDKHQNDVSVEEKKTTAEEMGHSTGTAQTYYTLKK